MQWNIVTDTGTPTVCWRREKRQSVCILGKLQPASCPTPRASRVVIDSMSAVLVLGLASKGNMKGMSPFSVPHVAGDIDRLGN